MKTLVPPALLEDLSQQWRIDWLHEHATQEEDFDYPDVSFLIKFLFL